jgi:hypothetical protein
MKGCMLRRPISLNLSAMSWTPNGSPCESIPAGMEIAGIPARLADAVNMSLLYIFRGESDFSPSLKAVVGEVGVKI